MSDDRYGLGPSRIYRGTRTLDASILARIEAAAGEQPAAAGPFSLSVGEDGRVTLAVDDLRALPPADARALLERLEPVLRALRERAGER